VLAGYVYAVALAEKGCCQIDEARRVDEGRTGGRRVSVLYLGQARYKSSSLRIDRLGARLVGTGRAVGYAGRL
jgi:hypothetical protein